MASKKKDKKDQRLVVSRAYFELTVRKAEMFDRMFEQTDDGLIVIRVSDFKEWDQIEKAWDKAGAAFLSDTVPYEGE